MFLSWYFSRKALPYWAVMIVDCIIVVLSMLVAHVINGSKLNTENILPLTFAICAYMVCFLIGFLCFHTYRGVLRYSSFTDLVHIAYAMACGSVLVMLLRHLFNSDRYLAAVSGFDLLVGSLIATILMWLMRMFVKVMYDMHTTSGTQTRILIFGTKEGGISLAKSIRNMSASPYHVEGFITHMPDMMGHILMNVPVLSATDTEKLWKFIHNHKIKAVFISPLVQDFFVNDCQTMISKLIDNEIKILMIPPELEWDGRSNISHMSLREVNVEDLMPRKKIEVDMKAIGKMLAGKRILITGAAGSIGSEMGRQVAKFNPAELILIDQAETPMHDIRLMISQKYPDVKAYTIVGSICNESHMEGLFKTFKPEYVFHAAAYKHVPMMEDNPAIAVQNNIYGTRVIADLSVKYGTKKFVMISTDKAVNPTNVMGCSKRICEIYCQSLNSHQKTTQFVTTRFGNVLGSNGSVIPIFKEQILRGGPVTVTHKDIIRYFMLIPEACKLVLEAGTMGDGGEIFVFDMGEPVRIADMAQRMIDLMGAKDVKIVYTGLRDGEKLYEEILNDNEQTIPTEHPKIMIAKVREYAYEDALKNEKELYELSFGYDDMAIVKKMKEIVPEYKSQHSKYEELD
ncbi:MAG: nucleoside-diphosphate sugar epimerase/dehydratase [Prevotella sp.]|nr:nucleoside-diphosphate sugar epimerase/dehydratase [Prevotella sp.]